MKINKTILAAILTVASLAPVGAKAESNTISPYSRFGYGLLADRTNTMQKSMGGVGYAMRSGRQINFMNPASYAAMDSLTFLFDMGIDFKALHTADGNEKGNNFTGGLNYITIQAPLTKWLSASVGMMPISTVGYSFGNEIRNGETAHQGNGDLNEIYLGIGAQPFKGFTAGVNVGYLFGTLVNSDYIYTTDPDTGASSTSLFERQTEVRDYTLRFGLQYGFTVATDHEITLGAVYEPAKTLRGHALGIKYDVTSDTKPDTLANIRLRGNAGFPELWGAGISYQWQKRVMAEVDFTYQPWKGVKYANISQFGDATSQFSNRWRVGAGLQFISNPRGSWLQRVNCRLGGYFNHDYLTVQGNNVEEYGVSLGFGFPAPSSKTMINLAIEYRNRRATPTPLVKENYLVVTLGVNFNELWFWRNKLR